jgi:hypothetical protein
VQGPGDELQVDGVVRLSQQDGRLVQQSGGGTDHFVFHALCQRDQVVGRESQIVDVVKRHGRGAFEGMRTRDSDADRDVAVHECVEARRRAQIRDGAEDAQHPERVCAPAAEVLTCGVDDTADRRLDGSGTRAAVRQIVEGRGQPDPLVRARAKADGGPALDREG